MTTKTLLTPVSITATGGGIDLDVSRLAGEAQIVLTTLNTAGTSPTLACKLQSSTGTARGYEYETQGTVVDNELREGASTGIELALKFTQSGAKSVKRVGLFLKKQGTIAAGKKLTLKIETDSTGDPSGTALGTSGTVDIDTEVSTTAGMVMFTFATPVDLADATVYHLVLSGDYSASASNNVCWRSNTVASGGTFNTSADGTTFAGVTATQSLLAFIEQYTFADITGGGFTTVSTAGNTSVQTIRKHARSLPAFMRLYSTIGGTSNPAFATSAVVVAARVQEQA